MVPCVALSKHWGNVAPGRCGSSCHGCLATWTLTAQHTSGRSLRLLPASAVHGGDQGAAAVYPHCRAAPSSTNGLQPARTTPQCSGGCLSQCAMPAQLTWSNRIAKWTLPSVCSTLLERTPMSPALYAQTSNHACGTPLLVAVHVMSPRGSLRLCCCMALQPIRAMQHLMLTCPAPSPASSPLYKRRAGGRGVQARAVRGTPVTASARATGPQNFGQPGPSGSAYTEVSNSSR